MERMIYLKNVVTLALDRDRCVSCGMCLLVCPRDVLSLEHRKAEIVNRDACIECGACARNCPTDAIYVKAGVGCAAAVINSMLGRTGSDCCCSIDKKIPE